MNIEEIIKNLVEEKYKDMPFGSFKYENYEVDFSINFQTGNCEYSYKKFD